MKKAPKLRPEDRVWLGILARTPELNRGDRDAARTYLKESGFPEHIIDEHVKRMRKLPICSICHHVKSTHLLFLALKEFDEHAFVPSKARAYK